MNENLQNENSLHPLASEPVSREQIAPVDEKLLQDSTSIFGFWVYLMTDLVLFASLFAVYAVLRYNTFGGPTTNDIFSAPFALTETLILLTSSFTVGLSMIAARMGKKGWVIASLLLTTLLGIAFLSMELREFHLLISEGNGPQRSGFLSSYFALVGTHGLHVAIGLLWAVALMLAIVRRGLTRSNMRKLALFSMFWHFLDLIWIFLFTVVYLLGII